MPAGVLSPNWPRVVGGGANAALATLSVRAARRAFGGPPDFADQAQVDTATQWSPTPVA